MRTFRSLRFFAPDGVVADPPATKEAGAESEPLRPLSDLYKEAYAEHQDKETKEAPKKKPDPSIKDGYQKPEQEKESKGEEKKGDEGKPEEDKKEKEEKDEVKPISALDAALEAVPEKKDEAAPESALKDLPETLPRDGRSDHWAKARGAISKLEATVGERDKIITQLKKDAEGSATPSKAIQEENDRLKAENNEYKDAIVALNIELLPEHRAKYVDGRKAIVAKASSKLNAFGGKGELIEKALGMQEGRARSQAINEALDGLEPAEQTRVLQFVAQVDALDDEKTELMKDPVGAWDKLQKSEALKRSKAEEQAQEYKKTTFDGVFKAMPDKLFLLRTVDPAVPGAKEHNEMVETIRAGAFRLLGTDVKPEELVENALWGKAAPRLQELLLDTRGKLKTALAAIADYEKAGSGFQGGQKPKDDKEEDLKPGAAGRIFSQLMQKAQENE